LTNPASIRTRSWLFTPATRPDRFAKAFAAGVDVAILDLENAVAPGDKAQARTTALDYLAGNPEDGALHALRINGLDTRAGISDWTHCSDQGLLRTFWCCPRRRRPAIFKSSTAC
jgi:(S)-citramalyl-CoA lyase